MKYKTIQKIKYNDKVFLVLLREDKKYAFLKIVEKDKYVYPTAQEFLHLSSVMQINNQIKF